MKNDLHYRPRYYQTKNVTRLAIFKNESNIRIQNTSTNSTNKLSFDVQKIVQRHKEKEAVKRKTYNSSEVFSIHKTSYKSYSDAINNYAYNQTQLLQKRLQPQRKSSIKHEQQRKDHIQLSKPKNLSITCPEIVKHIGPQMYTAS